MTTPTAETHIDRLIHENADAPADRLIRALYLDGFRRITDVESGREYAGPRELLELWYSVDELIVSFDDPMGKPRDGRRDYFVRLIHQHAMTQPHIEDIADYSAALEDELESGPCFPHVYAALQEPNYRLI